ncbi:MFS transporter [Microvirga pudoricolor]|uniref:MFS transporter n=1 Tax=Microvirga pudoricolor TaxID=2778729 RepID=UPI00194E58CE|nr:MFS transporter [Microvirga pudoricolor]MBM6593575.1 MFS transporter [Microvirga pudoricolor]
MTSIDQVSSLGHKVRSQRVRLAKRVRLATAFGLMAISGLVWTSFSLFLVAIEGDVHWSRVEIAGAFSVFALTNALTAPAFGHALSRWDSRRLLAAAALVLGLALCGLSLVETPRAYWIVFGFIGGLGSHCTSSYAVFAVLAGRFRDRPATAMAIADAGSSFATFLGLPIIHWIIVTSGWRSAYLALGLLVAVVGGALHLLAMDPVRRVQQTASTRHLSIGMPLVLLLAIATAYFCGSAAYQGLITQQVALLDDYGVAENLAVWVVALAGLILFVWRIGSGYLCDLWGPERVMMIAATAIIMTFASITIGASFMALGPLLIFPLAGSIAFGGQQVMLAATVQLMTHQTDFARILGICRMASGIGMAVGPLIAGYAYDLNGGYKALLLILAAISFGHVIAYVTAVELGRKRHSSTVAKQGG